MRERTARPAVRIRMKRVLASCAALALTLPFTLTAAAGSVPKGVQATYNWLMNGMSIGVMHDQFESDGKTYRIVSDTRPMGVAALIQRQPLRFSSTGGVARDGLRPVQFEARRSAGESPQATAEFDWPHQQLTLKYGGKVESAALPATAQDRLSVMYQFMYLPLEKVRQVEFPIANGRKLDRYRYRVTPDVELDTALGRLKTVHLVKQREPGDSVNEVWLSPQHHNLPVRMLIVEKNGMRYEQIIQSLEVRE